MCLIRINEVVENFGISSRTLRYYEQAGILWSYHPDNKIQRYYDDAAIERLKQIMVLRKLEIPIKDIASIYKDNSTAALIQAFVNKLESLDKEITALTELKQIVDDFLQKMLLAGIKKISAITLLYEETEKRLASVEKDQGLTYKKLAEINHQAMKLRDVRIIRLPAMRVLTSCRKPDGKINDLVGENMQNLFADYGLLPSPGLRNCFYYRRSFDDWVMIMKIPEDFINSTPYTDTVMEGGLYAVASSYMETMDETFTLLKEWVNENENFELDVNGNGDLCRLEMIEELMPWDIAVSLNRYQQDVFVPVRFKKMEGEVII